MIKFILPWIVNIAFLLVLLTPNISFSAQDRRTALVIGNGSYQSSPLRNPASDAKDMAEALRNLGFSVTLKMDANLRVMKQSIKSFGKNLRKGGVGLFYYAGHGLQVNGRNYLVPIGADVNTESEIEYEAVDAGRVLGQMEDAGNDLNIIILDACRDNPFARSFRSSEKGLAKMDAPTGSFLAYATAPGSVAADGTGRNGLYTSKLLKYMVTPGLELEKLFKYVRIEVANASGTTQVPWESSSLMGDFYFNPKRGIAVVESPSVKPQKPFVETPKLASISPKVTEPKIIERDGNFVKFATGVVYDKNTGFEWYAGPDKNTNWNEAKTWVESLNVAGGGWRMPTRQELRNLYKKGAGERNMTPLLETTGRCVWTGETKDSYLAYGVGFSPGYEGWRDGTSTYWPIRGFAVRFRGQEPLDETPKYAAISPEVNKPKVIASDGTFIAYDNGTVKDTKTDLVWASKDNGENINWKNAKRYCENYRGGGYTDWRMPTIDELAELYDKNMSGYNQGYGSQLDKVKLTKLIHITYCCLYASDTRGSRAAYFDFDFGHLDWGYQWGSYVRALPVRGGN